MQNFDKTWFRSLEEKQQAAEKARAILEQAGMREESIESYLMDDELTWSVCDDPERVLTWNDRFPDATLDTLNGVCILSYVLID